MNLPWLDWVAGVSRRVLRVVMRVVLSVLSLSMDFSRKRILAGLASLVSYSFFNSAFSSLMEVVVAVISSFREVSCSIRAVDIVVLLLVWCVLK